MKYYLLIYYSAAKYPNLWDSIAVSADFYPNEYKGDSVGDNQQSTPIWGDVVPYVICKSSTPTQEMTDIINAETDAWNVANPNNQTGSMQMIFEESEKHQISAQLLARQTELIDAGVIA